MELRIKLARVSRLTFAEGCSLEVSAEMKDVKSFHCNTKTIHYYRMKLIREDRHLPPRRLRTKAKGEVSRERSRDETRRRMKQNIKQAESTRSHVACSKEG